MTGKNVQPEIIDLIGDAGKDLDAYFNPAEFELRASLEGEHYWHVHRRAVIRDVITPSLPGFPRCPSSSSAAVSARSPRS